MILCGSDRNVSRVQTGLRRHVMKDLKTVLNYFYNFLAFCQMWAKNNFIKFCLEYLEFFDKRERKENSPIHGRPI